MFKHNLLHFSLERESKIIAINVVEVPHALDQLRSGIRNAETQYLTIWIAVEVECRIFSTRELDYHWFLSKPQTVAPGLKETNVTIWLRCLSRARRWPKVLLGFGTESKRPEVWRNWHFRLTVVYRLFVRSSKPHVSDLVLCGPRGEKCPFDRYPYKTNPDGHFEPVRLYASASSYRACTSAVDQPPFSNFSILLSKVEAVNGF